METLNISIKNIMLAGEAPLVIDTLKDLVDSGEFKDIGLYRRTGVFAFSDYKTLNDVNKRLNMTKFYKTQRLDKKILNNNFFQEAQKKIEPISTENQANKTLEYYFPIRNSYNCQVCHGSDHQVRGIAHFKISTKMVYKHITKQVISLSIFFLIIMIISGTILIIVLSRLIVNPVIKIGNVVTDVGKGNLDVLVKTKNRDDEIGILGEKINEMIKGLKERFILSRYVSHSTERAIKSEGDEVSTKKEVTVLFSDIRSFTSFSESHQPKVVVDVLNEILSTQAEAVEQYNGDIDNFIGDAIMGIFENPYDAVRCAYHMIKNVDDLSQEQAYGLKVGIGIATGDAIAGDIGSANRRKYTVVGDTVNLASRLSALAPPRNVYLSEFTKTKLEGKIVAEEIPGQKIKGKKDAVNVYKVKNIKMNVK